jgi:predicted lipoprotein with Yx(FWY)xxD motif
VTRTLSAVAALAAAAALVAGCGGSGNSAEGGAYGNEGGRYGEGGSAGKGESSGAVSVATVGDLGKVLVDSKGFTLYYFEKDKGGKSACYGACASAWPPLTTGGAPHAMSGAESSMLGTTKRKDGTTQVAYAGWPLYTYVADTKPGEDKGTDVKAFGASWYPLHPNGKKAGE